MAGRPGSNAQPIKRTEGEGGGGGGGKGGLDSNRLVW